MKILRPAITLIVFFTLFLGLIYPLAMTFIAQVCFPHQANGSIINVDGKAVGSELIGQEFSDPGYFWGRPSATSPVPYNAAASSGSNLGPTNPALFTTVQERIDALRAADPGNTLPIPADLVTSSGSGLDPDITPAAALYQVHRVAQARHLSEDEVRMLVERMTKDRFLGLIGEPRVNVLKLNLELDRLAAEKGL